MSPLTIADIFGKDWQHPAEALPDWLQAQRAAAQSGLQSASFPTRRDESWKYTNLRALTEPKLSSPLSGSIENVGAEAAAVSIDGEVRLAICFDAEGKMNATLTGKLAAGVSLERISAQSGDALKADCRKIGEVVNPSGEFTQALHSSLLSAGWVLRVAERAEAKLHIVNAGLPLGPVATKLVILAGAHSNVRVRESFLAGNGLRLPSTDILAESSAKVDYHVLQYGSGDVRHLSVLRAFVAADASVRTVVYSEGGRLVRFDSSFALAQANAHCEQLGLYALHAERHVDHHTNVEHIAPSTLSKQLYKGIVSDQARAVFNGRVHVQKGALKTSARQLNRNLLLSPTAEIDTKPQLEIDADDVKCSHGATIGQLREDEIFYLRSRGIPLEKAKSMLCYGFAEELIFRVGIPALQPVYRSLIASELSRLAGEGVYR